MSSSLIYTWDGDVMIPLKRFAKLCDDQFVIGEEYRLEVREDRSMRSHSHFFAELTEVWRNLSDEHAERFPTMDHLRRWCLIKAGYRDERSIVCSSKAEAQRVAAFMRPADEFAVVTVNEAVVTFYTAKSQSVRAMGRKDFQESKQAVLDIAAGMIGVSRDDLRRNAGRTA